METASIIVPTYNRADLIIETLESVRAQTYSPIELIIVDDGSTDQTSTIVSEWIGKTRIERCQYVKLKLNAGKVAAVNEALEYFKGNYVMILDSDDVLLPNAIYDGVEFLHRNVDVGMVCAKAYVLDGYTKTEKLLGVFSQDKEFTDLKKHYGNMLLRGNAIISSTVLMRRDVVQTVGKLNSKLRFTHDWEYWMRVEEKFKIGFLGEPSLYYRTNVPGASSLNRFGTFKEICCLLKSSSTIKKSEMIKAILYQMKYNAWLVYHDGNPIELIWIISHGILVLTRISFGIKT
jgi:glycosyltransferase involved in cell wall biosynthesis